MRLFAQWLLCCLLLAAAPVRADMASLWLVVQSPTASGTFGSTAPTNQFDLRVINVSGASLSPPITMRTTLPEGISFRQTISADIACTAAPTPRDVTCVRNTALANGAQTNMKFIFDVAPTFNLIGPNAVVFDATIENAQFPLPPSPVCETGTGVLTQCARRINDGVQSRVEVTNLTVLNDDVLTQNASEQMRVRIVNAGYNNLNGPMTLRINWPTGVSFVSRPAGQLYTFTCSAAGVNPTVCTTTASVNGTFDFLINVAVAANIAVPGPIRIWTEIGNNTPQPIPTAPDCATDINQLGCFEKFFNSSAAPSPTLEITGITHTPATLPIQANAGQFEVSYRNSGTAAAGNFFVSAQLPPGFSYHSLVGGAGFPLTACTASGTAAAGQLVRCNRSAGLSVNGSGSGVIRVSIGNGLVSRAAGTPIVVTAIATAADDSANPNLLVDCASTPEAAHCEHHDLPVLGVCGTYLEDIYCNGYE
ncbi:hypothetical protein C7S18_20985 [Ahniella affigens]|uniref:DUF11 domain-containing protein n=1 Tax=Ahniella affigens TaxID=2021234 RepID=A0A2P1PXD0_9GAMM|nr:hypothetical protein [Ahniella affigens]AVP99495.1 hypothetical protein C7S18_20985 [Ahniella affigens]